MEGWLRAGDRARKFPHLPPVDPVTLKHGNRSTYVYYGCRCDACQVAASAAQHPVANARYKKWRAENPPGPRKPRTRTPGLVFKYEDPSRWTHGTRTTYTAYGCRCQECRDENARAMKRMIAARAERILLDPSLRPHGVTNTHDNWGCRCFLCRQEKSVQNRQQAIKRKERKNAN